MIKRGRQLHGKSVENSDRSGRGCSDCDGTARFGVPERLRSFPGMRYIITSNGARILDQKENRTVYEKMITKEETQRILYTLEQFDSLADLYFEEKALGCLKSKERVSEFYPENMQNIFWNQEHLYRTYMKQ